MKKHKIGWLNVPGYTPETWNPIIGCSKISEGCANCYAEKWATRLAQILPDDNEYWCALSGESPDKVNKWSGFTFLKESALEKPLHWKKPRAIFVNSMGDLFHENTPFHEIDHIFHIMAYCPQHLFIVLTKRAKRMGEYFADANKRCIGRLGDGCGGLRTLPNVWLGVTTENQEMADERIPYLLKTPAAVRFVSVEPMIGPVEFDDDWVERTCVECGSMDFGTSKDGYTQCWEPCGIDGMACGCERSTGLDWVICGGESGPGAREMNREWAQILRDQCQKSGVPFFFKQWGDYIKRNCSKSACKGQIRCNRDGDVLDSKQHHEFPKTVTGGTQ